MEKGEKKSIVYKIIYIPLKSTDLRIVSPGLLQL